MPEKGDLINQHNYLDILFRLLYEDAVHDLRNGIKIFETIKNNSALTSVQKDEALRN